MNRVTICFFLTIIFGCNSTNKNGINKNKDNVSCPIGIVSCVNNEQTYEKVNSFFTKENLSKIGPIKYLEYLKKIKSYQIIIPSCRLPNNWIHKKDIDTLIILTKDYTVCTKIHVPTIESNTINLDSACIQSSKIGIEALRLLNGFLTNEYPCNIKFNADTTKVLLKKRCSNKD